MTAVRHAGSSVSFALVQTTAFDARLGTGRGSALGRTAWHVTLAAGLAQTQVARNVRGTIVW